MRKKVKGLGLVDPKAAKTNLLCKWIVEAMEPRESNLQHRFDRFNLQRGRRMLALIGLLVNNTKALHVPRSGDTFVKHGKSWLKAFTNSLPTPS